MSISMIITTSLFEVYFSRDKQGRDNTKFNVEEKDAILSILKTTEDVLTKIVLFSRTNPRGNLYRIPIIFEKVLKKSF